jgi:hypothetical protein
MIELDIHLGSNGSVYTVLSYPGRKSLYLRADPKRQRDREEWERRIKQHYYERIVCRKEEYVRQP